MMKVLVTGGAGFIGSHLVEALLRARWQVAVVDDLSAGKRTWVPKDARFYKLDVRSPKLRDVVTAFKPSYVCHLAAQRSVTKSQVNAAEDASVNIVGSLNVLEAVKDLALTKFLFVSTAALYGEAVKIPTPEEAEIKPGSPYALAKFTVEKYLDYYARQWGVPTVVVRPANVFGPRQEASGEGGVVAIFSRALLRNETITIDGKGDQTRDFVFVTDVASALVSALTRGDGVYNLSTSTEVSVRELVINLGQVLNVVPKVTYVAPRVGDIMRSALQNTRARRELNWEPQVPIVEGLRLTLRWLRDNTKL